MICVVVLALFIYNSQRSVTADTNTDEVAALIDAALYTRHEFFGAQAIVPYPTAEARNRLADVLTKHPDNPTVLRKLAQLDEKLGREAEALRGMQTYVEHEPDKEQALATLGEFFHRRAQFPAEAESLERLLTVAPEERRVDVFRRLIELAEKHRLDKYLTSSFFEQIVNQNPSAFEIVKQYQDRLIEDGDYVAALNLVRQNKDRFPSYRAAMLESEVSLLDNMGREKEAESVYTKAFDPF
jgi:tetratricopeptide (TPR) repeat protein